MPELKSNTARQLEASLALVKPPLSQEQIKNLIQSQEKTISELTEIIAGESNELPESRFWRDAFCHSCDKGECNLGTARELAEKIDGLGWRREFGTQVNLICAECQEVS